MHRLLALVAFLSLFGCGGSGSTGSDAGASDTGSAVPGKDAEPAGLDAALARPDAAPEPPDAEPPDADPNDAGPTCTTQAECGDPVADTIVNTCEGGHCRFPGALVNVDFESYYDQTFSQPGGRPQVQLTRLLAGTRLDGTPLTCSDVLARSGGTDATKTKLDVDPQLNLAFRNLTVLSWTGSTQGTALFRLYYDAPRGPDYVLFAEAWYGPRSGNYGTGARASSSCTEHVDLSTDPKPKLTIQFKP